MFWRSVVGKLAVTILLLVSFVLFILTIFLLEFFETFHVQEAEKVMLNQATKITSMFDEYHTEDVVIEITERVKDPNSQIVIIFEDGSTWVSSTTNKQFQNMERSWFENDVEVNQVISQRENLNKQMYIDSYDIDIMMVGTPIPNYAGAVYIYQSLDVIEQTKAETTRIIFLAAGIAIVLTTIFAFFLSTRITAPLIRMREAAIDLTRGEFNTKVPILTNDEIGELGIAFNKMGKQLNFHIHALRQEKEQLASIVSSMADGVLTLNRQGDIIMINPTAQQFIEDCHFERHGDQSDENLPLPEELEDVLNQIIRGDQEVLQEVSLQGRNWVMIMTPLYDQDNVRGAVAVIRDMTEERRLDKLRKDFIANVSHELRTPISLLQGYSEAIVDDIAESKEEKNELAQIIHDESLRMSRLVNELLDIARMEAGHIQLNYEEVHVDEFVRRIIHKFQGIASDHDIALNYQSHIKQPVVTIDADRIEQVFTNLIDNAIHHTKSGGQVNVVVHSNEQEISVEIKDSGTGIPEDDLPFIFERFYKTDKARTRDGSKKGTGLGLPIAKNIVSAHQGTIIAKSKTGQGTTFSFTIPHRKKQNHSK